MKIVDIQSVQSSRENIALNCHLKNVEKKKSWKNRMFYIVKIWDDTGEMELMYIPKNTDDMVKFENISDEIAIRLILDIEVKESGLFITIKHYESG